MVFGYLPKRLAFLRRVDASEPHAMLYAIGTPLAARQAAFVVAHLTPQEGEDLFRELGNMSPSKSSLDRLPKHSVSCAAVVIDGGRLIFLHAY